MKRVLFFLLAIVAAFSCSRGLQEHTLHILCTDDVHGAWFDSLYTEPRRTTSLMAVNHYADSIRAVAGKDNVLMIDSGDCLQGDNATYYYNYVSTELEHPFVKLMSYMGYDAVVVGNHDIETGHPVYDKVTRQLERHGIPFLAGNAIRTDNGKPYFPEYKLFRKAGMKVLVLGYTNPNMKAWLQQELWSGMTFESLIPLVQERVDALTAKLKPDVVVVAVHSGNGDGDGSVLESQGLDLFNSLRGVDVLLTAHDHRQVTLEKDDIILINTGNKARYLGHGEVKVTKKGGKVVSKDLSASLIPIRYDNTDTRMSEAFRKEFLEVKDFTLREIGELRLSMRTRDAYTGMCPYTDLIHTVQMALPEVQLSFVAPLTYNGTISRGTLIYNDLFTIYPFENQMFVIRMTGEEVRKYLEYSYSKWIRTWDSSHVLRISHAPDARTQAERWSFDARTYNFDSCAGINYTVDVTKPYGSRVNISSMADGSAFNPAATYNVALTSYRASGGGDTMPKGAGITSDELDERVVARYPEIRELIYDYVMEHKILDAARISDRSRLGTWSFVPESIAPAAIEADMKLVFGR